MRIGFVKSLLLAAAIPLLSSCDSSTDEAQVPKTDFSQALHEAGSDISHTFLIADQNKRIESLKNLCLKSEDPIQLNSKVLKLYGIDKENFLETSFQEICTKVDTRLKERGLSDIEKPNQDQAIAMLWNIFDVIANDYPYSLRSIVHKKDITNVYSALKAGESDCDVRGDLVYTINKRLNLGLDLSFVSSPGHAFLRAHFTEDSRSKSHLDGDLEYWKDYIDIETNTGRLGFRANSDQDYMLGNEDEIEEYPQKRYLENLNFTGRANRLLTRLLIDESLDFHVREAIAQDLRESFPDDVDILRSMSVMYTDRAEVFVNGTLMEDNDPSAETAEKCLEVTRSLLKIDNVDQIQDIKVQELSLLAKLDRDDELLSLSREYHKQFPENDLIRYYYQLAEAQKANPNDPSKYPQWSDPSEVTDTRAVTLTRLEEKINRLSILSSSEEELSSILAEVESHFGSEDVSHELKAQAFDKMLKQEEAIQEYEKIQNKSRDTLEKLAGISLRLKKPQAAIEYLNQVLLLFPNDVNAYGSRAHIKSGLGDKREAVFDYIRAAQLHPRPKIIDMVKQQVEQVFTGEELDQWMKYLESINNINPD